MVIPIINKETATAATRKKEATKHFAEKQEDILLLGQKKNRKVVDVPINSSY